MFVFTYTAKAASEIAKIQVPLSAKSAVLTDNYRQIQYNTWIYVLLEDITNHNNALKNFSQMDETIKELVEILSLIKDPSLDYLKNDSSTLQEKIGQYRLALEEAKVKLDALIASMNSTIKIRDSFNEELAVMDENLNAFVLRTLKDNREDIEKIKPALKAMGTSTAMAKIVEDITGRARAAKETLNTAFLGDWEKELSKIETILAEVDRSFSSPEWKQIYAKLLVQYKEYLGSVRNTIKISKEMSNDNVVREALGAEIIALLNDLSKYAIQTADDKAATLSERVNYAYRIIVVVMAALTLLGVGVIIYIRSSVTKKLKIFVGMVQDFATGDGDLTKRVPVTSKDEIGQLAEYFNIFVNSVHRIINEVKAAADDVASGNSELASTMEELSTTFGMQSSQIASVAENMDSMNSSTTEMLHSLSANIDRMKDANISIDEGNHKLKGVVVQMNNIKERTNQLSCTIDSLSESSGKIGEILGVINDIADQTNLLALNAAIEAARAGDAGRGFAVVADEVRKLAERTQTSTSEISQIITSLQNESSAASKEMTIANESVVTGLESIKETDANFESVVSSVNDISSTTHNVNKEISDQFNMIQSINDNTQGLASGIEESVHVVSEVTTTVNHLQRRADTLKEMVGRFKV
jgi:methyl-accepting chemotaxis protein